MAIFKHGKTWWFEYRRRKPAIRVVKNTGFLISSKDGEKKAVEAFAAFKMGIGLKPKRSAMEGILEAIYRGHKGAESQFPIGALWRVYEDWANGKGKKVAKNTYLFTQNRIRDLVEWADERAIGDVSDFDVTIARDYVRALSASRGNKAVRNIVQTISMVWSAVGQIHSEISNPWKAVCPVNDHSSKRRPEFTTDEARKVMDAAKAIGHDWHPLCMLGLCTGMRYGDAVTLELGDVEKAARNGKLDHGIVDLPHRLILLDPSKTRHSSGMRVTIPISDSLFAALSPYANTEGFLFPEHAICYLGNRKTEVVFSDVLAKAGIIDTDHTYHSWRHTANTRMAEAGVPSATRELICGWSNSQMAKHYDHAMHLKELTEAVGKIAV